jgi:PAS domain S-box-containing protein
MNLTTLFESGPFMPHGHCYFWTPELVNLHAISDALIVLAYYSIPVTLIYFVRKRKDLKFHWMFVCFAVFILACGTTHLLEIWNIWHAHYWLSGGIKALTALASVPTAILLAKLIPQALALPSPDALQKAYGELERRVAERTVQLKSANETLVAEARERQRAEQDSRESEARLRAVLDATLNAVVVINSGGTITDWNARAEAIFGWKRPEALGRELAEIIIPPQHREAHRHGMKSFLASGEGPVLNRLIEMSALRRDGTEFPVELSISPLKSGDILTFCGFITDITARKRAEQKLRESQQLLEAIISNSQAVIYVKDLEGRYLLVNRRWSELFHLSEEATLGKTDHEFFGPAEAEAFRAMDQQVLRANHAITAEEIAPQDDGPHTYISIKCPLWDEAGKPYAVFGISTDISERKRDEERLQASFKEIGDLKAALDEHAIVAITDPQGKITYVNDKFCAISKYPREELLGQDHRLINSGHHSKEFIRELWTTITHGRVWHGEIKNKAKDGSFYWVDTTIVPFLNEQGKPRQYVAIRADITQRKRAEEEIQKLNAELERRVSDRTTQLEAANKELEAFSYSVSHDLRAPLRAVNGFASMALEDFGRQLPEEGRRQLEKICTSGRRMGELIDDLLAFSRLSRQPLRRQNVDPITVVRGVLDELIPLQPDRAIEVRFGPLPPCQGDPALLKQVWVNLLSNAIKYTRGREPAIVEIGCLNETGETVYFVRDNGTGFDMKYAGKLFGVFQRLHRSDQFEGTGVGLAIVQRIIHRHGGRVWAEAEEGRGATFHFTLEGETEL